MIYKIKNKIIKVSLINEMKKYFEKYYKYLKENNLEIEFKKLHFFKKECAIQELELLKNPKRDYLIPLIQTDSKKSNENIEN